VRIICATNRHLWDGVKAGQFREDLYYRIACMAIRMPPLRERLEDIDVLAENLLERINQIMKQQFTLAPDALRRLRQYHYPGNVRELRNILFVAASRCPEATIEADLVAAVLEEHARDKQRKSAADAEPAAREAASEPAAAPDAAPSLKDVEARHIAELLQKHGNSRKEVAAALGVSERTLYRKLKRYRLN
jgi:transcriptional regulator with PAS, ATPase and Fis domain